MTTTAVENRPAICADAHDVPFVTITARSFIPELCLGASVLPVGYDDASADTVQLTPAHHGSSATAPRPASTTTPGLSVRRIR
jgi:hypothetical protein